MLSYTLAPRPQYGIYSLTNVAAMPITSLQAAARAANAAIMSNGSSVTPSHVAQIAAQAVAVAMPVGVTHPPAGTTPMGQSWEMPG